MACEIIAMSTNLKQGKVGDLVRAIKKIGRTKNIQSFMTVPIMNKTREQPVVLFTDVPLRNINEGTGRTGAVIIWLMDSTCQCCPIAWNAKQIRRVVRSTSAAEKLSLEEGLEVSNYQRQMLEVTLGFETKSFQIETIVDNKSIIEALLSTLKVEDKLLWVDVAASNTGINKVS